LQFESVIMTQLPRDLGMNYEPPEICSAVKQTTESVMR